MNTRPVIICPHCLEVYALAEGEKSESFQDITCEFCNADFNGADNFKELTEAEIEKVEAESYELCRKMHPERF